MLIQDWLLLGLLAGPVTASWAGNLNYRSPSLNHPSLGISLHKVAKCSEVPSDGEVTSFKAEQLNFTHGVASGDPYATSVILWTRAAPSLEASDDNSSTTGAVPMYNPVPIYRSHDGKHISKAPVCLEWKIAKDKRLRHVVDSGTVFTSSDIDYTVKVRWRLPISQIRLGIDKSRSRQRILSRSQLTTTNSTSAGPTRRARLVVQRPHLVRETPLSN